jgi:hypothetical protein
MNCTSNCWSMLCTGLWTTSVGLMAYATRTGSQPAAWWAIMIALAACLVTGRIIANNATAQERVRIEQIAAIVANEMAGNDDVTPIRR